MRKQPLIARFIQRLQPGKDKFTRQVRADDAKLLPAPDDRHYPRPQLPGKGSKRLAFQGCGGGQAVRGIERRKQPGALQRADQWLAM